MEITMVAASSCNFRPPATRFVSSIPRSCSSRYARVQSPRTVETQQGFSGRKNSFNHDWQRMSLNAGGRNWVSSLAWAFCSQQLGLNLECGARWTAKISSRRPIFARANFSSLGSINDGVGFANGRLNNHNLIKENLTNKKTLRAAGVAKAELRIPQSVAGIVLSVKWAFLTSPSWESAAIATSTIFLAGAPVLLAGLSFSGYVCAYLLGLLTWRSFGWQGAVIISVYFILGTAATKVKLKQKEAAGIAEKRSGRRGPGSVLGSWTAGAFCASANIAGLGGVKWDTLWRLAFLASFCTKLSDTISSEMGKAYGQTTYLVTTFSSVPRGTEGAVSLEGTIAGLVASVILAVVAYSINLTDQAGAVICVVAAQIANLCESYIGAALQGRKGFEWITNDIANILNVTIGASLAAFAGSLMG